MNHHAALLEQAGCPAHLVGDALVKAWKCVGQRQALTRADQSPGFGVDQRPRAQREGAGKAQKGPADDHLAKCRPFTLDTNDGSGGSARSGRGRLGTRLAAHPVSRGFA